MKVIALILGVLAFAYEAECLAFTAPASITAGAGVAVEIFLDEGTTTLETITVTSSTDIAITTQTPTDGGITIAHTSPDGVLSLAAGLDYQTNPTHVVVVTGTDANGADSATITFVVRQLMYAQPNQCIQWRAPSIAGGTLATSFATGATAASITHASVSATTGYTYTITDGIIKNTAAVTAATTATAVTVIATASEAFGTSSTVTTTIVICINGGCDCTSYGGFSGSSALAAGLLSVIMVLVMQLK